MATAKKSTSTPAPQNYNITASNRFYQEGSKFLRDFDPGKSRREKNKRKVHQPPAAKANNLYDENGRITIGGVKKDFCDCLILSCPGE